MAAQNFCLQDLRGIIPGATSCLSDVIKVRDAGGWWLPNPESPAFSCVTSKQEEVTGTLWVLRVYFGRWRLGRLLSNCPGCLSDRDSFWISPHKVFAAITQSRGESPDTWTADFYVYLFMYLLFGIRIQKTACLTSNICQCPTGRWSINKHHIVICNTNLFFFLNHCRSHKMIHGTNTNRELPVSQTVRSRLGHFVYQTAHVDALQRY